MKISDDFEKNKYVHVQKFISEDLCKYITNQLTKEIEEFGQLDDQCPKSKSLRNNAIIDNLLIDLLPDVEEVTGLKLLPTYAYARLYVPGEELKIHKDRAACEISATLTLSFDGDPWPFYLGKKTDVDTGIKIEDEKKNIIFIENLSKIVMNVGEAVIYKGCEMHHWREEYKEGQSQLQVFLHYVDANGPFTEWKYDKRGSLTKEISSKNTKTTISDLTYWCYTDVLTSQDCDLIINSLVKSETEKGAVGGNIDTKIDESIRKVEKVVLPTYKGIGAILSAIGINANAQRWKFQIDNANQCEFLHYPTGGGRYKGHIDTFLSNLPENLENCRKLTVLAFLNDDFKGGKFFLQTGSEKFYPPQTKGTILVFPSFLVHGVEDVEEGDRYSAVCWLVGPWFK